MRSLLVASLSLVRPAAAAMIPFENCLPQSYQDSTLNPLQWVPLHVNASFTEDERHTLTVTVWGNVTGSMYNQTLPPPNSLEWQDPSFTAGKILREADPTSANPIITTLHNEVKVLTYEPWNNNTDFCDQSLQGGTCPLGPVFNATSADLASLPSISMTNDFYSSYAFTSFSATFIIKYGDAADTNIGCVSATITPSLGNLQWMLKFLPLMVLLLVGFATIFAGVFSPWGTTDIYHLTSNYGRDPDMLRLITPGFGDCLQYLQFIALTGGLSLSYPGFYQPIVSQVSWSALMFNQSFVSKAPSWQSLTDGIYVTNGTYGLQSLGQLVGMGQVMDIWAGMIVWVLAIIVGVFVITQTGFGIQWIYRRVRNTPEEDLRAKNIPFSLGNIIRVVFNYLLFPIVALSTFQLVVAGESPAYTAALAALTLALIIGFAIWLLHLILATRPRAVLFDDLPTVLLYGPLYNTYSDDAAAFALIPMLLTFLRGIAVGAVSPAGVAQLVVLAICEVVQILTVHAFRPYSSPTSMNAYHTLFSALRFASVLLMLAFIPQLGITDGPKGWIGYAILVIHAGVLVLGFFLNALQTIAEVSARMLGAGGDDVNGQTRGGLSKIFGMRQLSRRMSRREGPSRASQLSTTAMLDAEEASKSGYIMPSGRVRSESAGSRRGLYNARGQRSSSALDNTSIDVPFGTSRAHDGAGSLTPTTPGGPASTFSFLPSPATQARFPQVAQPMAAEAYDPYYRAPRRKRATFDNNRDGMSSAAGRTRDSWASGDWSQRRLSQFGPVPDDAPDVEASPGSSTPAPGTQAASAQPPMQPPAISFSPRTDYATREVDFYYGVRGQRLNSDVPSRKLGTGPADPTGPMASAAGWLRTFFGGKSKEKGKGFEVVRSSRMPPAMRARGGGFSDETPPEGIPVAMGVLRNGPIESDDEDEAQRKKRKGKAALADGEASRHDEHDGEDGPVSSRVSDMPPLLPGIDAGESIRIPSRIQSKASRHPVQHDSAAVDDDEEDVPGVPEIPRKSSRRDSGGSPRHSRAVSAEPPLPRITTDPSATTTTTTTTTAAAAAAHGIPAAHHMPSSRLPFERSSSQKRLSSGSSMAMTDDFSPVDLQDEGDSNSGGGGSMGMSRSRSGREDRLTSFGSVHHGSVSRTDPDPSHHRQVDLLGSSAEVVGERQ